MTRCDVITSFVTCSAANAGLQEIRRAVKPSGKTNLLKHVQTGVLIGHVADLLNPLNDGRLTGRRAKNYRWANGRPRLSTALQTPKPTTMTPMMFSFHRAIPRLA